ncbi:MAG: SIMPL domain-containing protein [Chitinophagales bacterium]|nr:SIMPL domain-containing protein [Chitinophagales bacterium]
MKRYLIAILLCCSVATLHAQAITTTNGTDKYIEVKVSDTMMVEADQVTLIVSIEEEKESWDDWDWDDEEETDDLEWNDKDKKAKGTGTVVDATSEEVEPENSFSENQKAVEAILNKYKLTYKFTPKNNSSNPFAKDFSLYENSYKVTIGNISNLEKIKTELNAIDNVKTAVTETIVKDKYAYELKLIDKLMKKANTEANTIATAMQVKLGKPLNVSNQSWEDLYSNMLNNKESMGGFGAIFSMMGEMFKENSENPTKVTISKSLIVRYAFE